MVGATTWYQSSRWGLVATIGGARSFVAIGDWMARQPIEVLDVTGAVVPDESTIRRVLARFDSGFLDWLARALTWARTHPVGARR